MHLNHGTLLQGGKYRIEKVLGQGGFGITYLAVHTGFDQEVAIKEFFMKEYCERGAGDSRVSLGTSGSREMVERFKNKFIKEARTLAVMHNHHIVKVFDVFEENDTAYYVMEYLPNGNLGDRIPKGGLSESEALAYIRQVCNALSYIHENNILHLDIKPSNILFRKTDEAVLIDFGISKHYDEAGGSQTSSTPVGISHGYAPIEQYRSGGVSQFSVATDVYSLGATLFKLLSGQAPPEASEVYENGLPDLPSAVTPAVRSAVEAAMSPRRKDRPQSIAELLALLEVDDVVGEVEATDAVEAIELTEVAEPTEATVTAEPVRPAVSKGRSKQYRKKIPWLLLSGLALACVLLLFLLLPSGSSSPSEPETSSPLLETSYSNGILRVKGIEYPMVSVAGGTFRMGVTSDNDSDVRPDERPVHSVTMSSYQIGKYEVTQELWEAVMGSNPSYTKGARMPVETVSWDDCQEFIRKLNELTGADFRLPTEAEWEFAARGGKNSKGHKYSGSKDVDDVAWHRRNSGESIHVVGSKAPNELGIYDMSGNVWEWCSDWYGTYRSSAQTDPKGASSGTERVRRGGSWINAVGRCRVSDRSYSTPDTRGSNLGLRLCH